MSEGRSRKVRKWESPEVERKAERPKRKAVRLKSEEENTSEIVISRPDLKTKSATDIAQPELKEQPTAHSKLSTEPMEVHHHPEVEKKTFKQYVLEGLMIFLAVMMGFFAESLREHINEQNRSKDYAVTLYNDLKSDSAELHKYITYFKYAAANTDSLMVLLSATDPRQIPSGKLYWFGLFGGAYHIFTPHDATLTEMKSSGSLRFFGDKVINRKLALYDQLCQSMKITEEKETGIYADVRKARAQIFEFKYNEAANDIFHGMKIPFLDNQSDIYGMTLASRQAKIDSFKKTNPPLLTYDKTRFNEYIEMVRSRFLNSKVVSANILYDNAIELMGVLKKKYSVEE